MIREQDLRSALSAVQAAECASVVGLSNMGKSAFLRALCDPEARAAAGDRNGDWLFVYVDCNLMPERSERAFHEIVLRNAQEALRRAGALGALLDRLDRLYQQVIDPPTPLRSPLAFNEAITALSAESGRRLAIVLDEFDDPFEKLDGRVFLNLRAMKDRFGGRLSYVVATDRPLAALRSDHEASEFIELFSSRTLWLGFLTEDDARALAAELAAAGGMALQADELEYIVQQAGGHPGLLQGVAQVFARVAAGVPKSSQREAWSVAGRAFDADPVIRQECVKLWGQFDAAEQEALMAWAAHARGEAAIVSRLRDKGILPDDDDADGGGPAGGEVWRAYVKRQSLTQVKQERGVRVDVEAGDAYVDGRAVEPLTELEYKLLLLLYGRLNKIVDKYTIVTEVWGEAYLDAVDDARIEKLISRLRAKLEPGVEEPRYLITSRGRGYKLVG
jgi:hypothetical protein